jgi:hypothetical protein
MNTMVTSSSDTAGTPSEPGMCAPHSGHPDCELIQGKQETPIVSLLTTLMKLHNGPTPLPKYHRIRFSTVHGCQRSFLDHHELESAGLVSGSETRTFIQ